MPNKTRYAQRLLEGKCSSCGQCKAEIGTRCSSCYRKELAKQSIRNKKANRELRLRILNHYGFCCACPGCIETEPLFLEFDHKENNGSFHRKQIGTGSQALMRWIIKNNFPDSIQVLCSNCNQGKRRNGGICPHQDNKSFDRLSPRA